MHLAVINPHFGRGSVSRRGDKEKAQRKKKRKRKKEKWRERRKIRKENVAARTRQIWAGYVLIFLTIPETMVCALGWRGISGGRRGLALRGLFVCLVCLHGLACAWLSLLVCVFVCFCLFILVWIYLIACLCLFVPFLFAFAWLLTCLCPLVCFLACSLVCLWSRSRVCVLICLAVCLLSGGVCLVSWLFLLHAFCHVSYFPFDACFGSCLVVRALVCRHVLLFVLLLVTRRFAPLFARLLACSHVF